MTQQRSPYSFAHLIQNWTQWDGDDANPNGSSGGGGSGSDRLDLERRWIVGIPTDIEWKHFRFGKKR